MIPPTDGSTPSTPRWKPLDARQRRVLGVLIEKAKTTPAGYPMTVNAVVTGANQKNNRDPLTSLDDVDVENALGELGVYGVVSGMDWLGRVPKYKHNAYDWFGVNRVELAVLAELLLRGAQPIGDLRARAARMEPIADLAALQPVVDALVARGLMLELTPPGRGQVVSHGLYAPAELVELRARHAGHAHATPAVAAPAPPSRPRPADDAPAAAVPPGVIAALTGEIGALRTEVTALRERVAALEARLEAAGG